jgi:hypothetical protein
MTAEAQTATRRPSTVHVSLRLPQGSLGGDWADAVRLAIDEALARQEPLEPLLGASSTAGTAALTLEQVGWIDATVDRLTAETGDRWTRTKVVRELLTQQHAGMFG